MAKTYRRKKTSTRKTRRPAIIGCGRPVSTMFTRAGEEIFDPCGSYFGGDKVLCDRCERIAVQRYPQGWSSYPGDVCRHGMYVGGCGADYMCGYCESGTEPVEPKPLLPPLDDNPAWQQLLADVKAGRIPAVEALDYLEALEVAA